MAYIGKSPSVGIRNRFLFTATSGQTTFSGADDDSRTLSYTDAKFLDIYLNGVLLDPNTDYTATTGTSVVLAEGAATDDLVEIIAFDTFSLFDGTFEDDVTVGRDLSVTRNVSVTGSLGVGVANPSTSLDVVRAGVQPLRIESTSGTEVQINMVNTGGNVQLEAHSGNFNIDADAVGIGTINPSGLMSFAKGSRTLDLKLEDSPATGDSGVQFRAGSGDFLGLAAGGGTGVGIVINDSNNIGIGNSSAQTRLFVGDGSGTEGITIYSGTTGEGQLRFADGTSGSALYQGRIEYNHSTNKLFLGAGGTTPVAIDSSGNLGIGTSPSEKLHIFKATYPIFKIESTSYNGTLGIDTGNGNLVLNNVSNAGLQFNTNNTTAMTIDSSQNVGIGTSSTTNDAKLIVSGTDGKHPIIKVSDGGGNGYTLLADNYTASESQVNFGISYSSAKAVISKGVKVSDTTDNVYLSSQALYATKPTAFTLNNDGSFTFLNTNTSATTAVDTAVSLTQRMHINSSGNVKIGTGSPSSNAIVKFIEIEDSTSAGIVLDAPRVFSIYSSSSSQLEFRDETASVNRMSLKSNELAINDTGSNFDFRVETQNSTNGFFIDASVDRIVMASGASEDSTLTINAQSSNGTITHVSNSSIPGTGTGKVQEGVYTISGNSSNSILSIPIFSQTNVWRSFLVELRFITGEYNKSGGPLGGYGLIEFHTLNGFAQFNTIERTGNISSFGTSGTNLQVNFTTAYTGGLNNHEGVIMYAKVLSGHPSYIEFDNATFN